MAVLEEADGFCARPAEVLLLVGQFPVVQVPVLTTLERIGR